MEAEKITVSVNERESVTALIYAAAKRERARATIVLGHGAGANQSSGFMRMFADGIAARGIDAVTFNFLYAERGKRLPDPGPRLEACYRAVIDAVLAHRKLKSNRLVIGGKSMGGRIASQVAAANSKGIAGLVFLGYPMHPPGRPDKLRAEHLKDVRAPMLFVQGSRDAFGTPAELRSILKQLKLNPDIHVIEGGDHSFKVPKSAGVPQEEVYESAMDTISEWVNSL